MNTRVVFPASITFVLGVLLGWFIKGPTTGPSDSIKDQKIDFLARAVDVDELFASANLEDQQIQLQDIQKKCTDSGDPEYCSTLNQAIKNAFENVRNNYKEFSYCRFCSRTSPNGITRSSHQPECCPTAPVVVSKPGKNSIKARLANSSEEWKELEATIFTINGIESAYLDLGIFKGTMEFEVSYLDQSKSSFSFTAEIGESGETRIDDLHFLRK